jgi:alanyl-tRNA synthetase
LGTETHQAGSLVAPDRLRFDFTSLEAMSPAQVERVAEIVNAEILENRPVSWTQKPMKEAVADGAMALFGEKYGDIVRVVDIDGYSKELCGGTHVTNTGQIGPFVVLSEGSVAAGTRRIEAVTGEAATERMLVQQRMLEQLGRELRTTWQEIPAAVSLLQEKARSNEREVAALRGQLAGGQIESLLGSARNVNGLPVIASRVAAGSREDLRTLSDQARDRLSSGVLVLGAEVDGAPALLVMATKDLVSKGVHAGNVIREIAPLVNGRGGGRPDLAEAGGKNTAGLDAALDAAVDYLANATL